MPEERFAYTDIADIQTAPRLRADLGNVVRRREYAICFWNGRSWNSNTATTEDVSMPNLIGYVSGQSGVPVDELDVLEL